MDMTPATPVIPVTVDLRQELRRALKAGALDLPVLPSVVLEIDRALAADADTKKLADVIRRDATVAAKLLRIANSPLYRPVEPVVSVQHAFARLGMQKVKQIALAVSLECRVFFAEGFESDIRQVVRHSLAAAFFGQEIGKLRRSSAEEGFLCGLLHDLGRPAGWQCLAVVAKKHPHIAREEIIATVDEMHAEVGHALALRWRLPEKAANAARYHHVGEPPDAAACAVHVARLADLLAHVCLDEENSALVTSHPSLGMLELYPQAVESLLDKMPMIRRTVAEAM
jgi:HD-like signal output (HDOD) protein